MDNRTAGLAAAAALNDPSRRAVYEYVLRTTDPVARDQVARDLGMVRGTAAFHLDRLAKEGLLLVSYRRLSGRTGPGSGRPAKLYAAADAELSVSVPERRYDLAGELMAAAIEDSAHTGGPVQDSLRRVAADAGAAAGSASSSLAEVLVQYGFEPQDETDGTIILRNCPFHKLARNHRETVCGLNLDFLSAAAASTGGPRRMAVLDPAPGRCCVRLGRRGAGESE